MYMYIMRKTILMLFVLQISTEMNENYFSSYQHLSQGLQVYYIKFLKSTCFENNKNLICSSTKSFLSIF